MKPTIQFARISLTLFVLIVSMLVILNIFGVLSTSALKGSSVKIGLSLLVLVITSFTINWISESRK